MHIQFISVNDAFARLVQGIYNGSIPTIKTTSRNGNVLQIVEPVIITYTNPRQRVLFNTARDANPFFHLYEALWMLAGRNDVTPLAYYAKNMTSFSDDGKILNGAYGYRWRHALPKEHWTDEPYDRSRIDSSTDQLQLLVKHLSSSPDSRRAVLAMWNVEDDLLKIGGDEFSSDPIQCFGSKDTACNLSVCFSIRKVNERARSDPDNAAIGTYVKQYLDMTVFNRSNDLIWGALGANVVHFSLLQEYMACCLGIEVGVYNQTSNNLHVYESNWKPTEWLDIEAWPVFAGDDRYWYTKDYYPTLGPLLVKDQKVFDASVKQVVENFSGKVEHEFTIHSLEPFLENVAIPMLYAFYFHKRRDYLEAHHYLEKVQADDWRLAATNWIAKREKAYKAKETING